MRGHIQIIILFAVFLTAIPFIALLSEKRGAEPAAAETESETVLILFGGDSEPKELSMRDYIIGATAAQMPADFEPEALKAQAVLAHTYALRRRAEEKLSPSPELRGADLSDDSVFYNAYFTDEQIRSLYPDSYDEVMKKLSGAADYALTRTLTFEGEPIIAAFHAISCGRTESAENAWGESIPYLVGTDSSSDSKNKLCECTLTLTEEQLSGKLKAAFPDVSLDGKELTVKVTERTEAGSAATVELCGGIYVSGFSLAEAAGLPSACYEVSQKDGSFTFTCKGRGHLVGLSQYGAQDMAASGKTCEEILSHYFKNAELKSSAVLK